ncbi:hypothetical protein MTP03_21870 [Tsukamurella sp. PLM1]|nr:hypothetical protein MTP03_21870 [Tsukamurella sp. PLM1]
MLQDLGEGETMADRLRRTPSSGAATVLSAWAQALGRMHAGTYGRERDLSTLARREHTDSRNDPVAGEAARAAEVVPEVVGGVDDAARAVLDAAVAMFTEGPSGRSARRTWGPTTRTSWAARCASSTTNGRASATVRWTWRTCC